MGLPLKICFFAVGAIGWALVGLSLWDALAEAGIVLQLSAALGCVSVVKSLAEFFFVEVSP